MKIRLTLLFTLIMLLSSCSSMPKGERLQAVNAQKDQAVLYLQRGNNEYTWNNFDSALHQYQNAFTHASSVDWIDGMVRSLVQMSRSSDRIKAYTTARVYLDQAADLIEDSESRELALLVVNRETEWLLFNDSPASALRLNDQVITGIKDIRAEEAGEAWRIRGAVLKTMKEYDNALQAIDNALEIDKKGNFISELASDYYIQASVLSLSGREVEAIDSMSRALEKDKFIEKYPRYSTGFVWFRSNL